MGSFVDEPGANFVAVSAWLLCFVVGFYMFTHVIVRRSVVHVRVGAGTALHLWQLEQDEVRVHTCVVRWDVRSRGVRIVSSWPM